MDKISLTLRSDQVGEISDRVAEGEYESRSEAVRDLLDRGLKYDTVVRERDDLQEQLAARNKREEEVTDLANYVQEEREWRSAPIWVRANWWLTGKDS